MSDAENTRYRRRERALWRRYMSRCARAVPTPITHPLNDKTRAEILRETAAILSARAEWMEALAAAC